MKTQREYWNSESESFQKIYSHDKSALSNLIDRIFRADMYGRFEYAMGKIRPLEGKTVLDVGCGSGKYSVEAARHGALRVVGLDISENMVRLSRRNARENGVDDRCSFIHSSLDAYVGAEKFDACIGMGLFDYVKEPLPLLKKMRDATGDVVVLSFPRLMTWRAPIRKTRLMLGGCEVYFYSRSRVDSLMAESGFPSHEVKKIGNLYCVTGYCRRSE
ncbi:MAG: methyltransferase domain-containing protein [Candidatus Altiarchaeota archaeon]